MSGDNNYQKTLDYLYSFVDHSLTRNLRNLPEHFDLDRMQAFMEHLGHPEIDYPVLHVAGTKGKGSVCAFCAAALQSEGYRVGLYTSPHLWDYTERIAIDNAPIPEMELIDLVDELRPYLDAGTKLTTFEITTGIAFLYLSRMKVDVVVAEVGLGGRLDATNVVDPLLTVITSISLDHTQVLGETLAEIAFEKSGIIKPNRPVIVSPQKKEAQKVIERIARERRAPLFQVGRDFNFQPLYRSFEGQTFKVWQPGFSNPTPVELSIPLLGIHQVENAATAYAALILADQKGLNISLEAIRKGFARTSWPGRFQILQHNPPIVVDSAHNRDAAHRLIDALDAYFPDYRVILVFGASEDKDIIGMLDEMAPKVDTLILTRSYHPRAADPNELIDSIDNLNFNTLVESEVVDAFKKALLIARDDQLILVTGSIFIAAGVLQYWYNRNE